MVALRGMTIMPEMVVHFDISRERSIAAVQEAMLEDQQIFLATQREQETEGSSQREVYEVGTVASVKQIIKLPKKLLRVLVSGETRGILKKIEYDTPYLRAEVEVIDESDIQPPEDLNKQAMIRSLKDIFIDYAAKNGKMSKEGVSRILEIQDLKELVDEISANIPLYYLELQEILNQTDFEKRYEMLSFQMVNEVQIMDIKEDIRSKVKERVDKHQREYILREQLKLIREELGDDTTLSDAEEFEQAAKKLKAPKEVKEKLSKEISRFKSSLNSPAESGVLRTYIETLLEMPWNKAVKDSGDMAFAEEVLEEDHYGLEQVKERVLEFLAVRSLTKKGESPILCLAGPPGTGKTSIAKSLARALKKPYVRISLGGVRDEAEIRGHRRTYVGAMPGRIMEGMKRCGTSNPVMVLDEVDKLSKDYSGDPASALLEVLDPEQNNNFTDHYMNVPYDLSDVLFVCTANTTDTIPEPLLNRMEVIQFPGYTAVEKFRIARKHLLPKAMKGMGIKSQNLKVTDQAIETVIHDYTRESGVRGLKKQLDVLCRYAAVKLVKGEQKSITVSPKRLPEFLDRKPLRHESILEEKKPGIVTGLAWTAAGGEILFVETLMTKGEGKVKVTGQLGDVMKESAITAMSYVRSVSRQYKIPQEVFRKNDLHIHIPEGAVPKDGPSAGITMATALLSAITDIPVRADVAMTGEITLRGRVLPIGGLKEKILAARTAGIKTVLVPKKNEKDIEEIAGEIKAGLAIHFVETMEDVLAHAFTEQPGEKDSADKKAYAGENVRADEKTADKTDTKARNGKKGQKNRN